MIASCCKVKRITLSTSFNHSSTLPFLGPKHNREIKQKWYEKRDKGEQECGSATMTPVRRKDGQSNAMREVVMTQKSMMLYSVPATVQRLDSQLVVATEYFVLPFVILAFAVKVWRADETPIWNPSQRKQFNEQDQRACFKKIRHRLGMRCAFLVSLLS